MAGLGALRNEVGPPMRRVCAWCNRDLPPLEDGAQDNRSVSHGLCLSCADRLVSDVGIPLSEYLDELPAPVVAVDATGTVRTGNQHARALLGKDLPAIEGLAGGDVFECAYATLPGGCGQTLHCSGCTIRNAVMETHSTGRSLNRIPAYLNRASDKGVIRISLRISTERLHGIVLLRIDEISGP